MNTVASTLPHASPTSGLRGAATQFLHTLLRALKVSAEVRAQRQIAALALECEALQPSFAAELRAAGRHGAAV